MSKKITLNLFGKAEAQFTPMYHYPHYLTYVRASPKKNKKSYWMSANFTIDYLNNNTLRYLNNQPVRTPAQYIVARVRHPLIKGKKLYLESRNIHAIARFLHDKELVEDVSPPGTYFCAFVWKNKDLNALLDILQGEPTTEFIDKNEEFNVLQTRDIIDERSGITIIHRHTGSVFVVSTRTMPSIQVAPVAVQYLDEASEMYYEQGKLPVYVDEWLKAKKKSGISQYRRRIFLEFYNLSVFLSEVKSSSDRWAKVWSRNYWKVKIKPLVEVPVISLHYLGKHDLIDEFIRKLSMKS